MFSVNPTLSQLQVYIAQKVRERGFDKETGPEVFMLFLEECGEMAKAACKLQHIKSDHNSRQVNMEHEAADVLWLLLDLCNRYGIDLEKAFREKEAINETRVWQ